MAPAPSKTQRPPEVSDRRELGGDGGEVHAWSGSSTAQPHPRLVAVADLDATPGDGGHPQVAASRSAPRRGAGGHPPTPPWAHRDGRRRRARWPGRVRGGPRCSPILAPGRHTRRRRRRPRPTTEPGTARGPRRARAGSATPGWPPTPWCRWPSHRGGPRRAPPRRVPHRPGLAPRTPPTPRRGRVTTSKSPTRAASTRNGPCSRGQALDAQQCQRQHAVGVVVVDGHRLDVTGELVARQRRDDDPGREVVPQRLGGGGAGPVRQRAHRARAWCAVHDDVGPALESGRPGRSGVVAPRPAP